MPKEKTAKSNYFEIIMDIFSKKLYFMNTSNTPKILYANPVFLDYRLPFYKYLNELFQGNFYVLYSVNRYHRPGFEHLLFKIQDVMGNNAIPYEGELVYDTFTKKINEFAPEQGGKKIPIAKGLFSLIRKQKADIIISEGFFQWTPLLVLYTFFTRKPLYIGYERTMHTERNAGWIKVLHRKLTDYFVTGYLVNGSETVKYLKSIGVNDEKIHIGGMNADSEGLVSAIAQMTDKDKKKLKKEYQQTQGLLFLFSGQMVERKGVKYLLQAWIEHVKSYPDDNLILLGDGYLYDSLRLQYGNISSIHLLGKVNYAQVYKYYSIADVFIMPTIEDNWSLVVPEAMACGLPVATSIYNGCYPELVKKDLNGMVFDTFNMHTIIDTLASFHKHDLKAMGEESKKIEANFSAKQCAQRVYEAVIKGLK